MQIRLVTAGAACVALVAMTAPASAAATAKASGGVQFTAANGFAIKVAFKGEGTPLKAKGSINFRSASGVQFHAAVTCFSWVGNQVTLSGKTTSGTPGRYVRLVVQDNGEPGTADLVRVTQRPMTEPPFSCGVTVAPTQVVQAGNLQVAGLQTGAALLSVGPDESPSDEDL